jgi:hypothetical protein
VLFAFCFARVGIRGFAKQQRFGISVTEICRKEEMRIEHGRRSIIDLEGELQGLE